MNRKQLHILLAVITVSIWGTTFVSTKVLLRVLTPVQIMLARYLIAYVALLVIHPRFHRSEGMRQELLCLVAALCGSTVYFLTENTAISLTQASNVSLLVCAAPILTALIAHLATRDEKLSRGVWIGFAFAICGIFLVVCNGHFVLRLSPAGDLLAVAAALSWACYTVLLRSVHSVHPPVYLTRRIFFYAILTMLPIAAVEGAPFSLELLRAPVVWGNLLFLGVAASSICYVLWYHVVGELGAVKANNFVYLNPLVTMIASVVILRERITGLMLAGAVLILLGVMCAEGTFARVRQSI